MHQARLFVVAIWMVVLISTLAGLAAATAYLWNVTTADEKYALEWNVLAHTRDALYTTAGKTELNVNGELRKMEVPEIALLTDGMVEDAWRKLRSGGMFGLLASIGVVLLISLYRWGYGRERMQDNQLRGAKLVEGKEFARLIRYRDEASPYEIADAPMRVKSETLHTPFVGAQGTGKPRQFLVLMRQVRVRGKQMVVYDPTGEFTRAFYRKGKDILMNPLDSRSLNWSIWNETAKDHHLDNMANGLIPDPAESDPSWALADRMVLKDVTVALGREGRRTNRDLYNAIVKSNPDVTHALLRGTVGATYADPTTERVGMSLKMTVQNQFEAFRFLPDESESPSIRRWVHKEDDSWTFITVRGAICEALKPVLSLWVDAVIKAVSDLEPIHREWFWFCIDELPTLQKLDILKLALTGTRKHGSCMVLGTQDFSRLYEIYGHGLTKTIISGCQTKLLPRTIDGAVTKLLAELMGQAETNEKDETLSYGLSSQRDGVNVTAR